MAEEKVEILFLRSFSFCTHVLSPCHMPDTVQDAGKDAVVTKVMTDYAYVSGRIKICSRLP